VITNADRWHKRFAFDGGIARRHPAQEGGLVHERRRHVEAAGATTVRALKEKI
jgi:hypothetical protein